MLTILSCTAICLTLLAGLSLVFSILLTGVPSLSSSKSEVVDVVALLGLAKLPQHAAIIDLGSGWGALLVALARAFPDATVQGLELSPFPYLVSRLRTQRLSNVVVRWGNFFSSGVESADAIVCYLMPDLMAPVSDLLDQTVKPGACVVTNTFLFRGRVISAARQGTGRGTIALYVWPANH
ncbi:methyltransferase [Paraburkholderia fynbosensis]|nr:methyltransferase [Paraburkholderia fynbosensis]